MHDRIETRAVQYGAIRYHLIRDRPGARVTRPIAELLWLLQSLSILEGGQGKGIPDSVEGVVG